MRFPGSRPVPGVFVVAGLTVRWTPAQAALSLHVTPPIQAVLQGEQATFHASAVDEQGRAVPGVFLWRFLNASGLAYENTTGQFDGTPDVYGSGGTGGSSAAAGGPWQDGEVREFQVEVRCEGAPEARATAILVVMAPRPFAEVRAVFPEFARSNATGLLPYAHAPEGAPLFARVKGWEAGDQVILGAGCPYNLELQGLSPALWGLQYTHCSGGAKVAMDENSGFWTRADGSLSQIQSAPRTAAVDAQLVEALEAVPGAGGSGLGVVCRRARVPVSLRGLLPLAGNAVAPPGSRDGWGSQARFQDPAGMVQVQAWDGEAREGLLVTDRGSHVLRLVTADGQVTTVGGMPGVSGHRDGPLRGALFNGPTFLATRTLPGQGEEILVADTGNHVIRRIFRGAEGMEVATVAGVPGVPGYRDHDTRGDHALFDQPHGLLVSGTGGILVADRGNACVRLIQPVPGGTQVLTFTGSPANRQAAEGTVVTAGLVDPKGMTWYGRPGGHILILDGHSLRLVDGEGGIRTLMGQPEVAGNGLFLVKTGDPAWLEPNLKDPWAICPGPEPGTCYLTDTGNHCLRLVTCRAGRPQVSIPVVGSRTQPSTSYGMLNGRTGTCPPLALRATLASPKALACFPARHADDLVVTGGPSLALVSRPTVPAPLLEPKHSHGLTVTPLDRAGCFKVGGMVQFCAKMQRPFAYPWLEQNDLPILWSLSAHNGASFTCWYGRAVRQEALTQVFRPVAAGLVTVVFTYQTQEGEIVQKGLRFLVQEPAADAADAAGATP